MTDELNWQRLYNVYDVARQNAKNKGIVNAWEEGWRAVESTVHALLAKPVTTREAARKAIADEIGTEPEYVAEKMTNALMRALSHFAPPASNAPILRMDWHNLRSKILNGTSMSQGSPNGMLVLLDEAVDTVYRLAQPVPEVDPDAGAKRLVEVFRSSGDHDYPKWDAMDEGERDGWRAVAAAEKTNADK